MVIESAGTTVFQTIMVRKSPVMLSKRCEYSKIPLCVKFHKLITTSLYPREILFFMRVLMISKACLVGTYQTKLEAIVQHSGVTLGVIVPPSWRDPAGEIFFEHGHTEGYELWVDPIRFNGQFHFYYYPTLKRRLAEFQPDILHIDEEPYNFATWLALRAAKKQGVKTVFFTWQNLHRTYPPPFRWMERQVLQEADYGIMGNQAAVDVFQQKGYAGPHAVIPQFGVAADLFTPPATQDSGRGLIIGAAGRLVPEKGFDLLITAVSQLQGMWRLHIAGSGPERPRLEALIKQYHLEDRIFLDGALPSAEMPTYLQQLDILVLPSRTRSNWKEQFGRILVEAMASGVAVVGSDSGEIPHVIGDAGLTFPEDNVEALTNQLQLLIDDPVRRESLKKCGRERFLTHYTQSQIAAQTVDVYRKMMEK